MASVYSEYAALGLSFSNTMKDLTSKDSSDANGVGEMKKQPPTSFDMDDCLCKSRDVIVLAEFSEIKGPVPLLTIPTNTKECGVDVDDFILKIMSVDYQASSSGIFRFQTDTQVLQTDVVYGLHAFVNYFTLNDVNARGFVRPMCLAYISGNRNKLEAKFSFLRSRFLQVSDAMKEENRVLFLEEVSLGLQQLKDLQYRYFQWKQSLEEEEGESNGTANDTLISSINLDQLVEQQNEYNKILQSARSVLENTHLCESLSPWKDCFSASELTEIEHYMAYVKLAIGNCEPSMPYQRRCDTTSELRPIAALSPFGVAIGVWHLCQIHSQFDSCTLELRGGCFWGLGEGGSDGDGCKAEWATFGFTKNDVKEALSNDMYLRLLLQLLPAHVPIPYGGHPVTIEDEIVVKVTSGNEASSSYYSRFETNDIDGKSLILMSTTEQSLKHKTELQPGNGLSVGSELIPQKPTRSIGPKFPDDDSSSDSLEYTDAEVSEFQEFPVDELWCRCIWTGSVDCTSTNPGHKILQFFKTFSKVAQHILYSLLIGRTVVIAGSNALRPKVLTIISALVYFVPVHEDSKYLRWHRGILVSAHIEKYKVIGLCVPERLTVHDMISPRDKNAVTILDVNSKKILGPAYSGLLLADVHENFDQNFLCAEALVLFLQAVFSGIRQKVLLFKALSLSQPKLRAQLAKDFKGIKGRDIDIITYLIKFMKV